MRLGAPFRVRVSFRGMVSLWHDGDLCANGRPARPNPHNTLIHPNASIHIGIRIQYIGIIKYTSIIQYIGIIQCIRIPIALS